jgi:murein DD-endopeptidase MepM/ murein hydrolase activator NlpD
MRRGVVAAVAASFAALISAAPALAAPLPVPEAAGPRIVDPYPQQMPAAGVSATYAPGTGGFLTLPYLGDHFVSSVFDHCSPNYSSNGVICRFDGTIASAGNGVSPDFGLGYSSGAGSRSWLFYDGHDGWDLGLYYEPVLAAADGVVSYSDWANPSCHGCSSGLTIRIDHGNGFDTYYGHLWKLFAGVGQAVRRGQVIGISGKTGNAAGEHLHFGVYKHGTFDPVDPYGWEGAGADPWPDDVGNLWAGGAAKSPDVPVPALAVQAEEVAGSDDIAVSWATPGGSPTFGVTVYADDGAGRRLATTHDTSLTYHGEAGHTYWFYVDVTTDLGLSDSAASPQVVLFPATDSR